ncbi:MAG: hypothetical protein IPJ81_16780 [Chitinophagaceae bacterium]|nr:hypothetical protein [Chitinophagaceae bacterium]
MKIKLVLLTLLLSTSSFLFVLKKQIADAHDIFHTIVKECRKEDEEKH